MSAFHRPAKAAEVGVEALASSLARQLRSPRPASLLLTKVQAAAMLGVGRTRTLQRLIDAGTLRTVRVGQRVRIPLAEVERFIVEGESPQRRAGSRPKQARHQGLEPVARPGNLAEELAAVRKIRI